MGKRDEEDWVGRHQRLVEIVAYLFAVILNALSGAYVLGLMFVVMHRKNMLRAVQKVKLSGGLLPIWMASLVASVIFVWAGVSAGGTTRVYLAGGCLIIGHSATLLFDILSISHHILELDKAAKDNDDDEGGATEQSEGSEDDRNSKRRAGHSKSRAQDSGTGTDSHDSGTDASADEGKR
ncbi:hypothetical protein RQP46_009408 [Phenoliferia psychrophenolica]